MSQAGNKDNDAPPSLAGNLKKKLDAGEEETRKLFSSACIYRVPEHLRKLNESAYTPRLIAIGPLHQGNNQLRKQMQIMQDVKKCYTKNLFCRLPNGTQMLGECVVKMKENLDKARKCYAEEVEESDDENNEMLEMLVVDGCFILELLYIYRSARVKMSKEEGKSTTKGGDSRNTKASSSSVRPPPTKLGEGSGGGDPIFNNILNVATIKHDLLLLENQIPFFVLEDLFKLTVAKIPKIEDLFELQVAPKIPEIEGKNKVSLTNFVVSYFQDILHPNGENSGSETNPSCSPSDCIIHPKRENIGSETNPSCSPSDCVLWVHNKMTGCCATKNEEEATEKNEADANHYYHILHLLHYHFGPDQGENSTKKTAKIDSGESEVCCFTNFRCCKKKELEVCASDLNHAGVKFVPGKGNNLFDVEFTELECLRWFRGARFEIPTLHITDHTEPFLRNLIALEQCCRIVPKHFSSYATFMDKLINSEEDIQVLKKAKVIHTYLGKDEAVADLFNNLCKEIVTLDFYFEDKCQKASEYSDRCWSQFRGKLKGTYFASAWSIIAFCVALIAFGMEITNFVRSFLK